MMHTLPRLVAVVLAFAAPVFAERLELPVQGLEQRVDFWKKIFTQYGKDDIVIHDRVQVNLIYDVADESSIDSKLSAVNGALKEILSNIETPENLSITARQIRDTIVANGVQISKPVTDELIQRVHTQRGIKERFRDGIVRSGRYVESFRGIMEGRGVLPELALLPLVESSFQNVKSKAAAVGMWQFMRGTGRMYLTINRNVDQRLDPDKATRAAAKLLRDNYKALGSWPLAITAYNHGRGGMLKAKAAHGSDITEIIRDYRGPVFGYASMNFYSEFLAAVEVYGNYEQYFGALVMDKPVAAASKPVVLKASVIAPRKPAGKYKVRSGDTLWEIAERFGTSIAHLMEKNNLSRPSIYAGQLLMVK